jgi:hypothetical protein
VAAVAQGEGGYGQASGFGEGDDGGEAAEGASSQ